MTITVVALVSVNDDEPMALAEYFSVTMPLLERVGAKILKRFHVNEVVVGHRPAKSMIIVEYPDESAVQQVFGSAEYASIKSARDRAFLDYSVSVVSDSDAASAQVVLAD